MSVDGRKASEDVADAVRSAVEEQAPKILRSAVKAGADAREGSDLDARIRRIVREEVPRVLRAMKSRGHDV